MDEIPGRSRRAEGINWQSNPNSVFPERRPPMAFVVTEPCFGCKYTDCVTVCPCDCFHEGENMLFIDPVDCIDCEACVAECPVEAIYHEDNVPKEWQGYIELNAEMSKTCPSITEQKPPLSECAS
jgi:ferredoxin